MRLTFLSILLFIVSFANATTYYVSTAGNDANNGTSISTPWQSIAKVNSFGATPPKFAAGDIIAFKCGEYFLGTINVGSNGLTFKSYGTGIKPVIWGYSSALTSWTSSGNIYTTNVSAATSNLLVVSVNNVPAEMGRYPNSSSANGGYLSYESVPASTASNFTSQITDNDLPIAVPADWSTAEICVRKDNWTLERNKISSITATSPAATYNFSLGATINPAGIAGLRNPTVGYGYFIQNALSTLDAQGEWYFDDSKKKLSIYLTSPPASYTIRAATLDVLINIGSYDDITIQDLTLKGANRNGIASDGNTTGDPCNNITISNCDFSNLGARAINLYRTNNAVVQNCTFNWCLSNAVQIYYPAVSFFASNSSVTNCTFNNIGTYNGMGCFFDAGDFCAIHSGNHNALVQYNDIQNVGKGGIFWQGNDVTISKNFLNNTVKHLNDYGAIYTYATNAYIFKNRVIENNIILNTLGQPYGSNSPVAKCAGIYLDGRTMAVDVINNTIAYSGKNGVHSNNPSDVIVGGTPYDVSLTGNTFFDNVNAISFMRWKNLVGQDVNIDQMTLNASNNICYSRNAAHQDLYYTNAGINTAPVETVSSALAGIGTFNNNYYGHVNQIPFQTEIYNAVGSGVIVPTSPMSLEGWAAASTKDATSVRIKQMLSYTTSNPGSNLFSNGTFTSNITGISTYSAAASWDNTNQLGTGGSLKIVATNNPNNYSLHFSGTAIPLVAGKSYMLSFRTKGAAANNSVKASLRTGTGTINDELNVIAQRQTHSYNATNTYHEFVFITPSSPDGNVRFGIELERNGDSTYIDDLQFKTVDAVAVTPDVRFDYNATQLPVPVTLTGNYVDARNVAYTGSITLQPYTSAILFKTSSQLAFRPMPVTAADPVVEETIGSKITCYPNPAVAEINIDNLDIKEEWESVTITSIDGRNTGIVNKIPSAKKLSIELKGLAAGKYFAVLTNKKGKTKILSFVKL